MSTSTRYTYRGYLSQRSGYAMASMMDCLALDRASVEFSCASLSPKISIRGLFGAADEIVARRYDPNCWDQEGAQIIRCIPTDAFAPIANARSDQGFPASYRHGQRLFCVTVFEAPVWPKGWVSASNCYDGLILPNVWLRDAAVAAGVNVPVSVVPHALDVPEDLPGAELPASEIWWETPTGHEPIRVLTEGTYMLRKNLPAACEAFWRAFEYGEAVMLLHTTFFQPVHTSMLMRELWEHRARVIRDTGHSQLPALIVSTASLDWPRLWAMYQWVRDAPLAGTYLSMAYAEGVGYPLLQAAALGIPVICTDCPGHRSTVEFASLVKSEPVTPGVLRHFDPMDSTFRIAHIYDEDPWMRPSVMDAAKKLRASAAAPRDLTFQDLIRARHDPKAIGLQLKRVLEGSDVA